MNLKVHWCIVAVAIACFIAEAMLSRRMEPGVRVEAVTVAETIPALWFMPADTSPHPVALVAHGATASKETLFRFGEALAAAGFDCLAVDSPGHGESVQRVSANETVRTVEEAARWLGRVDVFMGHSMGSGAGAKAVRDGGFRPKLFIAVGNNPTLGTNGPPLLILTGRFEEFIRSHQVKARTDAHFVISPWCDHLLEPFDPVLVNAGVKAACAAVGKTPPGAPTAWRWRLGGLVLGLLGALGLIYSLPEISPQLARTRGLLVPVLIIATAILTMGRWVGTTPQPHRVPVQLAIMVITWLVLAGIGKMRIPRWSLPAATAILTIGCRILAVNLKPGDMRFYISFLVCLAGITTLILLAGLVIAKLSAFRGSRRDGDIAMAIFIGFVMGQWVPRVF